MDSVFKKLTSGVVFLLKILVYEDTIQRYGLSGTIYDVRCTNFRVRHFNLTNSIFVDSP